MFAPKQAVPDRPLIKGRSEASMAGLLRLASVNTAYNTSVTQSVGALVDKLECFCVSVW